MKFAVWNWDSGAGRAHVVVAAVDGAVETPDGLADTPVLITACGRIRPAESATVTESDEMPENLHTTCAMTGGRALARARSRSLSSLVVPEANVEA